MKYPGGGMKYPGGGMKYPGGGMKYPRGQVLFIVITKIFKMQFFMPS